MSDTNVGAGLEQLRELLAAIAGIVSTIAVEQVAVAQQHAERQAMIDSALYTIVNAEAIVAGYTDGLHITNISPDVAALDVWHGLALPGQPQDVYVTVRASAQLAGLFLSFGNAVLDPNPSEPFIVELGGRNGSSVVTVASGSTLPQMVAILDAVGHAAGFSAALSGTGIRIMSHDVGSGAFVSVRLIDPVQLPHYYAGIYRLNPSNTGRADRGTVVRFALPSATSSHVDAGQDVNALVNGRIALSSGATVARLGSDLGAAIGLTVGPSIGPANAQTLGTFRAFTLTRD